ncbi:MAG: hypothetical protein ACI4DY_10000 [Monoglobaceae bacterium]
MEKVNLKKGLFGYTQSSVQEYIESLNGELTVRTNNLVRENEQLKKKCGLYEDKINESSIKQDELLEKINSLSKEIETHIADKSKLGEQIDELKAQLNEASSDKFDYEQGQNELADIMLEAKRFANDLKHKTEIEFEQQKAANKDKIKHERERIEKYISDIDELSSLLCRLCDNFGKEIGNKRVELNIMLEDLTDLNSK